MSKPLVLFAAAITLAQAGPALALEPQTFHLQVAASTPSALPVDDANLEAEATIRHSQLQVHQGLGLATLGAMALTTGWGVYSTNYSNLANRSLNQNVHMALGGLTAGLYLSTAGLALTAPKGYDEESEGIDSITVHKALGWLHAAGMISTLGLGILTSIGNMSPVTHGIAGGTTLGLMALSAGVIAVDF